MKDNAHHCNLAGTLDNLSFDPLFCDNSEENAPNYEWIPGFILVVSFCKMFASFH